jgi:tRNA(Ile2) C34 agmatinyltransferase TiaS
MENYTLEIPMREDETCPDCGRETEKGYQCSVCIKRYENEIRIEREIKLDPFDLIGSTDEDTRSILGE